MLITAAVFLVALAVFLMWFVIKGDRGAKEPLIGLAAAFGLGLVAVLVALWLERRLIPPETVHAISAGTLTTSRLALMTLLIGGIEEAVKFFPVAFLVGRRKYFNEHSDGIIYFAAAGVAFGMLENFYYLGYLGPKLTLTRAALLLFFHPAAAATVGYFFARHRLKQSPLYQTGLALLGVIFFHALYDFGTAKMSLPWLSVSLMVTAAMNAGLFLLYRLAVEEDQRDGLAASGDNEFCRHCGAPNPHHFLYCEHCGNQT